MSGLLRRIRRSGAAEETRTEPTTARPDPAHGSAPDTRAAGADEQPLPAGVSREDAERRELTGRRRGMRRRARFLRRARELALRDLGGVVYETHRRQQDGGKVVDEKLRRLTELDAELHGLDAALGSSRGPTVIREPGIGGTCARCGELHGSDARFCAHCGANLADAAREAEEKRAEAERTAEADKAAAEPATQSGNGATHRPAPKPEPEPAEEPEPATTSDRRS